MRNVFATVSVLTAALTLASCNNPVPPSINQAPVAAFTSTGQAAFKPTLLDASASTDPEQGTLTYLWDLGNGQTAQGQKVQTSFAGGTHTVKLTVTDPLGLSHSVSNTIVVNSAPATGQAALTLKVIDLTGAALSGASVQFAGQTATTNAQGVAQLAGVPVGTATLLRVGKAGFISQVTQQSLGAGTTLSSLRISLRPVGTTATLDAETGGTLTAPNGTSIVMPPNALIDSSGTGVSGNVQVQMTPIAGADAAFPGEGRAISAAGAESRLMTYGMLDVVFTKNNQKLQLAPGKTAQLKMNLAIDNHLNGSPVAVGDPIPTWWFNENSGVWIEEGQGQVVASSTAPTGKALTMTVNHFTSWNWDLLINNSASTSLAVKCMYLDGSGNPTIPLTAGQSCAVNAYVTQPNSTTPIATTSGSVSPNGDLIYNLPAGMAVSVTGVAGGLVGSAGTLTGQNTSLSSPLIIPLTSAWTPPAPFSFTTTTYGPSYGFFRQVALGFTGTSGLTPTFTAALNAGAAQAMTNCSPMLGGGYTTLPCIEQLSAGLVQLAFPSVSGQVFTVTGTAGSSSATVTVTLP
jgi:hypothetical protein